ncbi:hypothetical protein CKO13_11490, partial [Halorhodospira neutriphila]|nr:hypothetical protein [Halorhodospira neutriphila]
MAEIERCSKPLAINPLKAGAPLGASLATLGFHRAMPVLHGSQGCTAFGKVYLVRHFNEPIPLQTTAMDPVSTVMGADANAHEALETVCSKSAPALVTLLTTGLSEAQGTDIHRLVREFREAHPEHAGTAVVAVNTPDFAGGLESGYAAALRAIVDALVPAAASAGTAPGRDPARVNVLLSAAHGPGDAEAIAELVEAFGLEPVLIPDLSTALDGHLADADHSPVTTGGRPVADLAGCGDRHPGGAKDGMGVEQGVLELAAVALDPRRDGVATADLAQGHDQPVGGGEAHQVVEAVVGDAGALGEPVGGGIERGADDEGGRG